MSKEFIEHSTSNAEFKIKPGQTLVINLNTDLGLDRIILSHEKDGNLTVAATGHSSFKFEEKRKGAPDSYADYLLSNPDLNISLMDYIKQGFWSQFNWGELINIHDNKKLVSKINRKIEKLVSDFEEKAAKELNVTPGLKETKRKK
jgi:hypothetical protein